MNRFDFQSEKSVNEKDVLQTSSINTPEWIRSSGAFELYVMDFGIILRSKERVSYFSLNDSKSMLQRFEKILNPGYFDIYTFDENFAETCIERRYLQIMEEYLTLFEKDARSLNRILKLTDILEIIDFVPEHQRRIFMSSIYD